jgi:hypothetical protein
MWLKNYAWDKQLKERKKERKNESNYDKNFSFKLFKRIGLIKNTFITQETYRIFQPPPQENK